MGSYGETISNEQVVGKVLRSLNESFDYLVPSIEESKDLSTYTSDELMSSLLAHETRVGGFRGRGRSNGRGRGRHDDELQNKYNIQCHYCKKNGHREAFCSIKQKHDQKPNFTEKVEEENNLFMAHSNVYGDANERMWFVDSGCSNQMTGSRSLFKDLDEKQKGEVRLGDDKQVSIEGRGTLAIKTVQGDVKLIHDVQYVPTLAHSLISVGQLMASGYSIVFNNKTCAITDKKSGHTKVFIKMTQNKMFPLDMFNDIGSALVAKNDTATKLWHFRYGHLNVNSIRVLSQNEMVVGLPKIGEHVFCEGCVYGKQCRQPFPFGKAWRASHVTVSRDVKFNEEERWIWNTDEKQPGAFIEFPDPRHEEPKENGSSDSSSSDTTPPDSPTQNSSNHTSPHNSASSSLIGNRLDIDCPISVVSRYMRNPTKQHLGAARRILCYVVGCLDDRKNTSGNIFRLGSGAVTWSSKKQETIALSSSEAEYAAATSATYQALWLQKLLTDFPLDHNDATTADIFTKSLPQAKHQFFTSQLGICEFESRVSVES
ncbi:hypothetical protein SASPL_157729 [Salvia splendens]|uniref:GAG-pre-integrase domain-containing protein n=1 Tax=Salvia splendens TaxID=180675 RepID=A0A8X8VUG8_SALSN|nr:hypothetical protein SASPL_157729 [Salvia splendens]